MSELPDMKQECFGVGCELPACCPYLEACTVPGGWVYLVPGGMCLVPGGGGVPGPRGTPAQVLPPPVNRMTDRCKNITLPQTSFAGGKSSR